MPKSKLYLSAVSLAVLFWGFCTASFSQAPVSTQETVNRFIVKLNDQPDNSTSPLKSGTAIPPPGNSLALNASVRMRRPATATDQQNTTNNRGQTFTGENPLARVVYLQVTNNLFTSDSIAALFTPGAVEYIERDVRLQLFDVPSDSLFPQQWYLRNTGQTYIGVDRIEGQKNDTLIERVGTAGEDVNLNGIYQNGYTVRKRPVIAILDTGVDDKHPELANCIWVNTDEIPENGIDDDHNGYVDDTRGYDFSGDSLAVFEYDADNDPADQVGHGSHIAGIIAAAHDGFGVVGICPDARIMIGKIFPNAFATVGAEAVIYAVNNGADIMNISWGAPYRSRLLDEAFAYATANNVFVAVASGNTGSNERFQPADIPDLVTVGASNSDGKVTFFSTYGAHIDLVAPGRDILSIRGAGTDMYIDAGEPGVRIIDSLYYLSDGTSMAAPMVAAAAGVLLAERPDFSAVEIENALKQGARDIVQPYDTGASYPGPDSLSGYGFLDIGNARMALKGPALALASPQNFARKLAGFSIIAMPLNGYNGGWLLEYSANSDTDFVELTSGVSIPPDSIIAEYTGSLPSGLISFRLTDDFNHQTLTHVLVTAPPRIEITSPVDNDTLRNLVQVSGFAHSSDFDSLWLTAYATDNSILNRHVSTREAYGGIVGTIEFGASVSGVYLVELQVFMQSGIAADSVNIYVESILHPGFPIALPGFVTISPAIADLDGDGYKEIIGGCQNGLHAFHSDGSIVAGFPVAVGIDARSVPCIVDMVGDSLPEILFTTENDVRIVNAHGQLLPGWPQATRTGQAFLGFPTVTLTELASERGPAVVFVNSIGQLRAYTAEGVSYFYSLNGLFTRIDPNIDNDFTFTGLSIPFVSRIDLNKDQRNELLVSYSAPGANSGLFLYNGRDGQPAFFRNSAQALRVSGCDGIAMGDVDSDGAVDVLVSGLDAQERATLWLRRNGEQDLPGWPIRLESVNDWIGNYPALADLNGDNIPEIIAIYSEFDIAKVFVFNLNGTPFRDVSGVPKGQIATINQSLGSPTVGDINGDGVAEILCRAGYLFPGTGYERLYAFAPDGELLPGFPIVTTAHPQTVLSTAFVPIIDDIDNDGLVEVILMGSGNKIHVWDMLGMHQPGLWDWPRFLHDSENGGRTGPKDQQIGVSAP